MSLVEMLMAEKKIALVNAIVYNGTGKSPIDNGSVVVQGDRILAVGQRDQVSVDTDAKVIDCSGKSIMPGLIDAHVHMVPYDENNPNTAFGLTRHSNVGWAIESVSSAAKTLRAGTTTVRDVGTGNNITIELRDAINRGSVEGPRILSCNRGIGITGSHGDSFKHTRFEGFQIIEHEVRFADGVADAMKAVREQVVAGADWIKIFASGGALETDPSRLFAHEFSPEELKAIVDEASRAGKKCAAHCLPDDQMKNCINAGVRTIEHGVFAKRDTLQMMKDKDISLVCTLLPYYLFATTDIGLPDVTVDAAKRATKAHQEVFRIARELGVNIANGTDAGAPLIPYGSSTKELELMVQFGMTPAEAISASTAGTAKALGIEQTVGTITEGKVADLLVVDGDVGKNVKILQDSQKVSMIINKGRIAKDALTMLH
jgi:imidazolonepropionase-like amidohydrolase